MRIRQVLFFTVILAIIYASNTNCMQKAERFKVLVNKMKDNPTIQEFNEIKSLERLRGSAFDRQSTSLEKAILKIANNFGEIQRAFSSGRVYRDEVLTVLRDIIGQIQAADENQLVNIINRLFGANLQERVRVPARPVVREMGIEPEPVRREEIGVGAEPVRREEIGVGVEPIRREEIGVGVEPVRREEIGVGPAEPVMREMDVQTDLTMHGFEDLLENLDARIGRIKNLKERLKDYKGKLKFEQFEKEEVIKKLKIEELARKRFINEKKILELDILLKNKRIEIDKIVNDRDKRAKQLEYLQAVKLLENQVKSLREDSIALKNLLEKEARDKSKMLLEEIEKDLRIKIEQAKFGQERREFEEKLVFLNRLKEDIAQENISIKERIAAAENSLREKEESIERLKREDLGRVANIDELKRALEQAQKMAKDLEFIAIAPYIKIFEMNDALYKDLSTSQMVSQEDRIRNFKAIYGITPEEMLDSLQIKKEDLRAEYYRFIFDRLPLGGQRYRSDDKNRIKDLMKSINKEMQGRRLDSFSYDELNKIFEKYLNKKDPQVYLSDLQRAIRTLLAKEIIVDFVERYFGKEDIEKSFRIYNYISRLRKYKNLYDIDEFLKKIGEGIDPVLESEEVKERLKVLPGDIVQPVVRPVLQLEGDEGAPIGGSLQLLTDEEGSRGSISGGDISNANEEDYD